MIEIISWILAIVPLCFGVAVMVLYYCPAFTWNGIVKSVDENGTILEARKGDKIKEAKVSEYYPAGIELPLVHIGVKNAWYVKQRGNFESVGCGHIMASVVFIFYIYHEFSGRISFNYSNFGLVLFAAVLMIAHGFFNSFVLNFSGKKMKKVEATIVNVSSLEKKENYKSLELRYMENGESKSIRGLKYTMNDDFRLLSFGPEQIIYNEKIHYFISEKRYDYYKKTCNVFFLMGLLSSACSLMF